MHSTETAVFWAVSDILDALVDVDVVVKQAHAYASMPALFYTST